jgi:putative transposase
MTSASPAAFLDAFDRVSIRNVQYRVHQSVSDGFVLQEIEGNKISQKFTHVEIHSKAKLGEVKVEKNFFAPHIQAKLKANQDANLGHLSDEQFECVSMRLAFAKAVCMLRREGKISLTYPSLDAALPEIMMVADKLWRERSDKRSYAGKPLKSLPKPCSSSVWNWNKAYRDYGLPGLIDNRSRSGQKGSRLNPEVENLLSECVGRYLNPDQPTKEQVIQDTRDAFKDINEKRVLDGLEPLPTPSRNTIRSRINSIPPFEAAVCRLGRAEAISKFYPVGRGLIRSRPLERLEMDDWTVDLFTIAKQMGIFPLLPSELQEAIALDGKKSRWHLCVAICCTTRCILGITLSSSPATQAALECLHMVVREKEQWADAVDASSPWDMSGLPDLLVTDAGSQFVNARIEAAAHDLGITTDIPPQGLPQLRATIERYFETIGTNLLPRLSGRSFSNVVQRGDYPSEERTVLSVHEFSKILVRWVVDVYHNTPHEGLTGETPLECWQRLSNEFGVRPVPCRRSRRTAFGVQLERMLSNKGIQILGVRYNSDLLMQYMRNETNRSLNVHWLAEDIGEVEVQLGRDWYTVPAVLPGFQRVKASNWLAACERIRKGDPQARVVSEKVISTALKEIKQWNAAAGKKAGIVNERWDSDLIERLAERTLLGFQVGDSSASTSEHGLLGGRVEVRATPKVEHTETIPSIASSTNDDWSF